jgi:hypothetical protein
LSAACLPSSGAAAASPVRIYARSTCAHSTRRTPGCRRAFCAFPSVTGSDTGGSTKNGLTPSQQRQVPGCLGINSTSNQSTDCCNQRGLCEVFSLLFAPYPPSPPGLRRHFVPRCPHRVTRVSPLDPHARIDPHARTFRTLHTCFAMFVAQLIAFISKNEKWLSA